MTITTTLKSWFLYLEDMGDNVLDATPISSWIFKRLFNLLLVLDNNTIVNWKRINSISTDTCSVMKGVWQVLSRKPELQHAFMILCGFHGLQLIIKDILDSNTSKVPKAKEIFTLAFNVITFFHRSPLEYARLRAKRLRNGAIKKPLLLRLLYVGERSMIC
jgi:hypothetical protein